MKRTLAHEHIMQIGASVLLHVALHNWSYTSPRFQLLAFALPVTLVMWRSYLRCRLIRRECSFSTLQGAP